MRNNLLALMLGFSIPVFAQSGLTVDWEWRLSHRCNNTSPLLKISGIPEETHSLSIQMNDLDFQNKDHGGGKVPHSSGGSIEIPEGALHSSYLGPCPGNFSSFGHSYQITVRALDANGKELSKALKSKDFSASTAK